jgi:hypothetical protein
MVDGRAYDRKPIGCRPGTIIDPLRHVATRIRSNVIELQVSFA